MTVYFMQQTNGGPIKIGHAHDPISRCDHIAKMFPYGAEIVTLVEGDLVTERFLHHCFAPWRVQTEWFRNCLPLWRLIADIEDNGRPAWLPHKETDAANMLDHALFVFGSRKGVMSALGYRPSIPFDGTFNWNGRKGGQGAARLMFALALHTKMLPSYIASAHEVNTAHKNSEAA